MLARFKQYHHDPQDPDSLSSDQIYSILVDRHGALWVGTSNALDLFDPNTGTSRRFEPLKEVSGLSGSPIYTMYEDRKGNIWLGTSNGLDRFNPADETFVHYKHDTQDPDSLSDSPVVAIKEDLQGDLWVGTMDSGLDRLEYSSPRRYVSSTAPPPIVTAVCTAITVALHSFLITS